MPIGEVIGKFIGEGAEKIAAKFGSDSAPQIGKDIEEGFYRRVLDPAKSFARHPQAAAAYDRLQNVYKPLKSKYEAEIAGVAGGKIDAKTVSKESQGIIAKIGTKPDPKLIQSETHKVAYEKTFGPKGIMLQDMLRNVQKTNMNMADTFADDLNVTFKQAPMKARNAEGLPNKNAGKSSFDIDMRSTKGEGAVYTKLSPYVGRNSYEKAMRPIRSTLAYKAAPIHLASVLVNIANSDGLKNLGKVMYDTWGPGREAAEARLLASNAIGESFLNAYREKVAFENGRIAKYAPGGLGEWIHKNMFIPGMQTVRYDTILAGANAGKLMAEEAAAKLERGDAKWALPALRTLNLDAAKIKAQGFKLAPEDIEKAYFHGANDRVFLDPYGRTPTFWRQSPMWRSAKAFTGFVTQQGALERRLILRQWEQGDYVGIARNIALKALAYPVIGSTIYEFDRLLSGEDWDDPKKHLEARYDATPAGQILHKLQGTKDTANAAKTTLNTLDMIARLGTVGSGIGYLRGANRMQLAQHLLAPEVNVGVQLVQDAIGTGKAIHYDKNHPHAADPLLRDMLSDTPSLGLGTIASHKLLPSRKEVAAEKHKTHRPRRVPVKEQTWNPFNYTGNTEF